MEKSSAATYDSLVEMYSGDKTRNVTVDKNVNPSDLHRAVETPSESGPALEVIELANGETIWSIVNGLRDDDTESLYASRTSFASEYSVREGTDEGVQVFFKEHARKNSGNSFPRKKPLPGMSRPETKVFYGSSAQIGRLIENISQGMEAGSFNILPKHLPGHSNSSSVSETEMQWTVEERLEHMLGSMGSMGNAQFA